MGNLHGTGRSHISLGMTYVQLETGTVKATLGPLIRNLPVLLREAPFAKSRAIGRFDMAAAIGRQVEMFGVVAQALHGEAGALKASRRPAAARQALQQTHDAVREIGWPLMRQRIEDDLSALGAPA